jgi:prepilin-type processing-associated H-X9-DG protein
VALEAFQATRNRYPGGATLGPSAGGGIHILWAPHVDLLPYLDQQTVYDQFDRQESSQGDRTDPPTSQWNSKLLAVDIAVYSCPSDSSDNPTCNYRVSAGTSPWIHETVPNNPQGALQGYRGWLGRKDPEFRDGKSHTTAFAEKLSGDRNPNSYTPWRDSVSVVSTTGHGLLTPDEALTTCSQPVNPQPKHFSYGGTTWILGSYTQTWYNHVLPPNSNVPDCVDGGPNGHGAYTARSLHPGGVNVLFADGRVSFTGSSIDLKVWRALGSINGGETASLP